MKFNYTIICLLLIFALAIGSCKKNKISKIPNLYKILDPESFLDNDILNPLNKDNVIFKPKKIFRYNYTYLDKQKNKLKSVILFKDECLTDSTIQCFDWANIQLDNKIKESIYPIDYIDLYVYQTNGNNSLSEEQTIIKYSYHNKFKGKILTSEQTGVVEDSSTIFLHPPRAYSFVITEFNPFPRVVFPLQIGKEWEGQITIPSTFLKKVKMEHLIKDEYISFDSFYKVVDTININVPYSEEKVFCYRISCKNKGNLGKTSLIFDFSEKYGFVKFDYQNIDSTRLILELNEIKFTSK